MPTYDYHCPQNGRTLRVVHGMKRQISNWAELCTIAGIEPGDTPVEAPVERLLSPVAISSPVGDSKLKNQGFTKLVKREEGVYENVTAAPGEKRYMTRGDAASLPNLKGKISD